MQEAQIIRYTRKKNGQLNGCLVAAKIGNEIRIGFSKCCSTDVFKKSRAKELAEGRMNKHTVIDIRKRIPASMAEDLGQFEGRILKYYKGCSYTSTHGYFFGELNKN